MQISILLAQQITQLFLIHVRGIKGEPVGIGRLERFCADYMMDKAVAVEKAEPNGHKVAVVGGGPYE